MHAGCVELGQRTSFNFAKRTGSFQKLFSCLFNVSKCLQPIQVAVFSALIFWPGYLIVKTENGFAELSGAMKTLIILESKSGKGYP